MRGTSRLRALERKARRQRETWANAETIAAHDWLWSFTHSAPERFGELFYPMAAVAEDYLDALEADDEEARLEASKRLEETEEVLLEAYREELERSGQT